MSMKTLFLISLFSGWFLTGLIWTIQIVHYPSFSRVGESAFVQFHQFHTTAISFIVVPLMLVELISSIGLATINPEYRFLIVAAFVLVIWLSTFLLSVPAHNELSGGFVDSAYSKLVLTNWIRTLLWTLKSGFMTYLLINSTEITLK